VRFREIELNRVLVDLADANRLSPDDQQIPLRRARVLVEIRAKREHHVVGVDGMTVGESEAVAEHDRVSAAIWGNGPRPGERGFGLLRFAIDVNEVGDGAGNHVTRNAVDGKKRIERLRLGTLADHNLTAGASDVRARDEEFFALER